MKASFENPNKGFETYLKNVPSVDGRYGEFESKAEIIFENGFVKSIRILDVEGKKPLPTSQKKDFKKLVITLSDEIVQSWINYFVYNKKIITKKIAGKL